MCVSLRVCVCVRARMQAAAIPEDVSRGSVGWAAVEMSIDVSAAESARVRSKHAVQNCHLLRSSVIVCYAGLIFNSSIFQYIIEEKEKKKND